MARLNEAFTPEKRSASTKAAWQKPEVRERIMQGISRRSADPNWRSAPHFQPGPAHPRYIGNADVRREGMSRYPYKKWRTDVFKRDGYTCQQCGKSGGFLMAHHIQHWATHPDLRYEVSNGITYCEDCHNATHGVTRRHKTYVCLVCGKRKTDGRHPRCLECGRKHLPLPTKLSLP